MSGKEQQQSAGQPIRVKIRLIADSAVDLDAAVKFLQARFGDRVTGLDDQAGYSGRKGEWLAYGYLLVDEVPRREE